MTKIGDDALAYIKIHRRKLIEKFANLASYPTIDNPEAFFMAGSPGAGKTEYSKSFIKELQEKDPRRKIVRIDADEIRDFLPPELYNHTNSDEVQRAAVKGVEILLDEVLHKNQEFLLDATFAMYDKSYSNITRCLKYSRKIFIYYIYQDPLIAWRFTKEREVMEGRKVPRDMFVNAFFNAKNNVNRIKKDLGKNIELTLITKNYKQEVEKIYLNIDNIDNYLKIEYNQTSLEGLLHDNI